jgi:CheY-like chemotaxis protein
VIAVVDDDALVRAVVSGVLEEVGFEVEAFEDAPSALAGLSRVAPALVLSDISMPGMDGLEFRKVYASGHRERRTPFLFFSGLGRDAVRARASLTGADDHLAKPASARLLVDKVMGCLRRAAALDSMDLGSTGSAR